ncbi:MAG: hypothetical protein RLZZ609_1169 [Cyanobacteriota bacterium]|jgi:pyrimidine deaminase RibD-like protein
MGSWHLPSIAFSLPDWVCRSLPEPGHCFVSDEEKMGLAIELSRLNVLHATGGPFGAVIFEATSGRLVAPGVNLVQHLGWAGAHAEMVAIAIARAIGFDEGVKANDWVAQLRSRGIAVQQNVCREQAVSVLNAYKDQGGLIYNGRASTASGGAAP